ncbi:helix-hairpin-helix domain-containing protein [Aquibacillus rhizosphaerae]|uniref:Helix-hairpin-helix domain-containing protein n=1 Tax=Aquibacillus rhizosphaerae TaxID=3051431 RepID=A0ABT7L8D4_9BACI|nr:helix-hairpin-helix domain-containing protein [Aquibacillus sp. LR5S19]MDL4841477.1 helix-hairpin-helix domain-containing protein [Aquibacillus sp. LR5S19]
MRWLKNNWLIVIVIGSLGLFIFINQVTSNVSDKKDEELFELFLNENEIEADMAEGDATLDTIELEQYVDVKGEVNDPGVYQITGDERVQDVITQAGGLTEEADIQTVNLAQKVFDEMIIYVRKIGDQKPVTLVETVTNQKIKINSATKEEILVLPGIGEVKAEAIISYREENGPFKTVEELSNVIGIGEKTVEKLKEDIQIP